MPLRISSPGQSLPPVVTDNPLTTATTVRLDEHVGAAHWPEHILVASGGSLSSVPALALARELADYTAASVELLAVFAPSIPCPTAGDAQARCETHDRARAGQLLRHVREQRDQVVRSGPVWPMRFESGDPPQVIARVAHEKAIDLVVVGIGRSLPEDRRAGDVTPAIAALHLDSALYAVAPGFEALPHRVLLALPEDRLHTPTLRAALACMRPGGTLLVARPPLRDGAARAPQVPLSAEAFALGGAMALLEQTIVHPVECAGEFQSAVLALADEHDVQLIAIPVRGQTHTIRTLLPNYAGPLLLGARRSVLVVPDPMIGGPHPC